MKKTLFVAAFFAALTLSAARPAVADNVSLSFANCFVCAPLTPNNPGNLLYLNPVGGVVDFQFGTQMVTEVFNNGNLLPIDTLTGATFTIPNGFALAGYSGSGFNEMGQFVPAAGQTLTINGGPSGTMSGTLQFITLAASNNSVGDFTITITLSNITGTPGTSQGISTFLAAQGATGSIQFNFSVGQGIVTVDQLFGLTKPTLAQGNEIGTLSSVPEPASLALLGTGLFALGALMRRRRTVAGLAL